MADPFKAKDYGEYLTKTKGTTISAADFVAQPFIGSPDKTRNKPIDPKLEKILAQVASETGVTFVVNSGGQDAKGTPGARRTGSTRHDNGGAADVMARDASGNYIDFSTPDGQKQWGSVVTRARSLGATGIGAGPDYMGNKTVHIGFGSPAAWSSTTSGKPVEPWLKTAYDAGAKMPPGSVPNSNAALSAIDSATAAQFSKAGFTPGSDPTAAVMAFQSTHGLKPDGIVGTKTLAALNSATTSPAAAAPSPVASRGGVVAPSGFDPVGPGPGSYPTYTGLLNDMAPQNAFNDPLKAAAPGSATGGGVWPPPMVDGPGIDMGGIIHTANSFTQQRPQQTAVASYVDVPRQRTMASPETFAKNKAAADAAFAVDVAGGVTQQQQKSGYDVSGKEWRQSLAGHSASEIAALNAARNNFLRR